ncbi:hypothetical protein HC725_08445 [Vibrio sp. S17_S38]|uniref:pectate lyase family protein n=1 Tax=Vibrio sp. S17_S38 TaxID=2720229 RepID=UPI00168075C6|nr:hypothetical protein [Vibrio sp. S17_S38]MBD1573300.1 hypothetical protein [Vibrio sp. S17_S38]
MKKLSLGIVISLLVSGCNYDITSLGADGWAAVDGPVTGGNTAKETETYVVENRHQLITALYGSQDANLNANPSNTAKIIYVKGLIDLSTDGDGKAVTPADYMAQCSDSGYTNYDDFYTAYRERFNPHEWNKQDLASNGKPQPVSGPLENARSCYQKAQANHIVLRVGSNTSILGVGSDAIIQHGSLVLGKSEKDAEPVTNVVIRNIEFKDAFDDFPGWSSTDSFKIDTNEFGQGDCRETFISDTQNPAACLSIEGGRWNSEYDLITLNNAQHVWVDHNTFSDGVRTDDQFPPVFTAPYNEKEQKVQHHDGLVDVTNGSSKVTISYNVFKNHDKTNLLGGSDSANPEINYGPGSIDVTFHHNYWENTGQRMPRVRFGRVHVYNNYYNLNANAEETVYKMGDAIILGTASKIYAENNVFDISGTEDWSKIIGFSSKTSNIDKCTKAGYQVAECGTYFYSGGNVVNNSVVDFTPFAIDKSTSSSSNANVTILDPKDENAFWLPKQTYRYKLEKPKHLKAEILANAGSGKLSTK